VADFIFGTVVHAVVDFFTPKTTVGFLVRVAFVVGVVILVVAAIELVQDDDEMCVRGATYSDDGQQCLYERTGPALREPASN
jgi:hypothetical protein